MGVGRLIGFAFLLGAACMWSCTSSSPAAQQIAPQSQTIPTETPSQPAHYFVTLSVTTRDNETKSAVGFLRDDGLVIASYATMTDAAGVTVRAGDYEGVSEGVRDYRSSLNIALLDVRWRGTRPQGAEIQRQLTDPGSFRLLKPGDTDAKGVPISLERLSVPGRFSIRATEHARSLADTGGAVLVDHHGQVGGLVTGFFAGVSFEPKKLKPGTFNTLQAVRPEVLRAMRGNAVIAWKEWKPQTQRAAEASALMETSALSKWQGKPEDSALSAEKAVSIDPRCWEAWMTAGYGRACRKDHTGAVEAYQRATALVPSEAGIWVALAQELGAVGSLPAALAAADRAVSLDEQLGAAHSARGQTLQRMGRYEEAIASYRTAIERSPRDTYSQNEIDKITEYLRAQKRPQ